jgi:hypothetical protein
LKHPVTPLSLGPFDKLLETVRGIVNNVLMNVRNDPQLELRIVSVLALNGEA